VQICATPTHQRVLGGQQSLPATACPDCEKPSVLEPRPYKVTQGDNDIIINL